MELISQNFLRKKSKETEGMPRITATILCSFFSFFFFKFLQEAIDDSFAMEGQASFDETSSRLCATPRLNTRVNFASQRSCGETRANRTRGKRDKLHQRKSLFLSRS